MNKKPIAAFIIIFIILLGVGYYVISHTKSSTPAPIIVNNPPKTVNTTTTSNSTTSNMTSNSTEMTNSTMSNSTSATNSSSYTSCISSNATVPIANGNFSTGTYADWNLTGQGFLNSTGQPLPLSIAYANANNCYYGQPWSNYNGNYFGTTYHCGIALSPGNLTSDSFQAQEPYLNFRISSAQDSLLYVELLYNGAPVVVNYYDTLNASQNTNPQSNFVNASLPLLNYACKNLQIRVVSGVTGGLTNKLDFIAIGDFMQGRSDLETPGTLVNSST